MANCANCGIVLEREWKFCVMCGTAVPERTDVVEALVVEEPPVFSIAAVKTPPAPTPAAPLGTIPGADDIPAVFRTDGEFDDIVPARKVNVPALISVGVAIIGIVLIVLVAIVVFTPRG